MPVLAMPGKSAVRASLVPQVVSRSFARAFAVVRRPLEVPLWTIAVAVAVLAFGGFLIGRQRPAHHYVAYFGYPLVLDTTTGKACYAVPPRPSGRATVEDPAYPLDGTANQLDTQETAGFQISICGGQ